jgi:hypothetical protein
MPLGVSVVGAVVLGTLLLRRGRSGLLMRGAAARAVRNRASAGASIESRTRHAVGPEATGPHRPGRCRNTARSAMASPPSAIDTARSTYEGLLDGPTVMWCRQRPRGIRPALRSSIFILGAEP